MELTTFMMIIVAMVFINNCLVSRMLGIRPLACLSRRPDSAAGVGLAVIITMGVSSLLMSVIYTYALVPLDVTYLAAIVFLLLIVGFVLVARTVMKKASPDLYRSIDTFLPIITTGGAMIGVVLLTIDSGFAHADPGLLNALGHGTGAGAGYALTLVLMEEIRDRLELASVPEILKGIPITFVVAGIMALAVMGFSGTRI